MPSVQEQLAAMPPTRGKVTNTSLALRLMALDHGDLTPAVKLALSALCLHYNPSANGQGCHISQDELAAKTGLSVSQVKRSIKIGRQLGLLRSVKLKRPFTAGQSHNSYDFRGIDPLAAQHWRGERSKLTVVAAGDIDVPLPDGRVLTPVETPDRPTPRLEEPTADAVAVAKAAAKSKPWKLRLDRIMDDDAFGESLDDCYAVRDFILKRGYGDDKAEQFVKDFAKHRGTTFREIPAILDYCLAKGWDVDWDKQVDKSRVESPEDW